MAAGSDGEADAAKLQAGHSRPWLRTAATAGQNYPHIILVSLIFLSRNPLH